MCGAFVRLNYSRLAGSCPMNARMCLGFSARRDAEQGCEQSDLRQTSVWTRERLQLLDVCIAMYSHAGTTSQLLLRYLDGETKSRPESWKSCRCYILSACQGGWNVNSPFFSEKLFQECSSTEKNGGTYEMPPRQVWNSITSVPLTHCPTQCLYWLTFLTGRSRQVN